MNIKLTKNRVAGLSVFTNSILVIIKLIVGILIGSVSIISEAIHSGMDLIAAIIAFISVRISAKAPDEEHAFGHGKVESISATVEALLIFVAAIWIIYEAINKIMSPHPVEQVGWGVFIMFVSVIINLFVSQLLFKVGKATESAALIANGWHLRTDVYTSAGVMVGLSIILIGKTISPSTNLWWIDPLIALLVALLITRAAIQLTVRAIKELMDQSIPATEKTWINNYLLNLYPVVRSFHRLRTRKSGPERFIDFHIVVDSNMTVQESHQIGDKIVADLKNKLSNATIVVHVEPCDGTCSTACSSGCLLPEKEREKSEKSN